MSKPLTKKEWRESVAEMWSEAVKSTYQDLIDEAVKAEREACAKLCESMSKYMDDGEECATAIRARGQA